MRSSWTALAVALALGLGAEHAGAFQAGAVRAWTWGPRAGAGRTEARCPAALRLRAADAALGSSLGGAFAAATDGCWAGWQASFDADTGRPRPLPQKYLTDAMIEWGQVPAGLELLSSEEAGARRFVLLYPEDGCANENLFGELTASALDLTKVGGDAARGVFTSDDAPGDGGPLWYLRTTFLTGGDRRTRVSLRYDANAGRIGAGTVIRVALERRWDVRPSALEIPQTLRASGGRSGLDARFVAQAIDSKCFAELPVPEPAPGTATLALPGDVTIRAEGSGKLAVGVGGVWVTRSFSGHTVHVAVE
jgi:hypothetical protein